MSESATFDLALTCADVAVLLRDNLGLRAGANFFPFDVSFDESDVDYDRDLSSPQFLPPAISTRSGVSTSADGPVAALPGFQQDLDEEVADIQDDVEDVIVYPVLSLGISIGLRR